MLEGSMSEDYSPLTTEVQAHDFLQKWPTVIRSSDFRDVDRLIDATVGLKEFSYLDVTPFYLACFDHPNFMVRMNAVDALADYARKSTDVGRELLEAIYRVSQSNAEPHVRAVAIYSLADISERPEMPGMRPWLIGLALNPNEPDVYRMSAYKSLIGLQHRVTVGDPRYEPWSLKLDEPVDSQFDWTWLHELKEQYGSSEQLDF
jgi:hypothetical protein